MALTAGFLYSKKLDPEEPKNPCSSASKLTSLLLSNHHHTHTHIQAYSHAYLHMHTLTNARIGF